MKIVINNGTVIDPKNRVFSKLNIGIENGKIVEISNKKLIGDEVIDADGLIVSPGFVDIHMHEDPYDAAMAKFNISIFDCMLRMGVTTAIGGNCGGGPEEPDAYLDAVDRIGIPINLGLLVPHNSLRKKVNASNKYKSVSTENILKMKELAKYYLKKGCLGISFGIRYIPGITGEELISVCEALAGGNKIAAAHIRDDSKEVIPSAMELIEIGKKLNIPVQVSHIGSMGAYGQMEELLSLIDYHKQNGVDVAADCYPYNAFSTGIGETTYDEGFLKRYGTTYESIEIAEGEYRGQRCSEEIFNKLRCEKPETITIGHVMKENEVDIALAHPNVFLASDGFMHNFEGHPRASGTFPRFISKYVREKRLLSLYEAIEKMTYLPSKRFGLNKGSISLGSDGDVVIFDYNTIEDKATFEKPAEPPYGIKYVLINGEVAVKDNIIINKKLGKAVRR
jgi:N-acyl-D-amino-acid deacylase